MAVISNYATLQTAIGDWLNRSDLSGHIPNFIQNAEERFQRDPRVRDPGNNAVLVPLRTTDPNWLLTGHPDIYLYGALVESAPFLKDDARVPVWEARLQEAIEALSGSVRLDPARTALALSSYAELQTTVADALNRGDLKNVIPVMVTLAERKLATDRRVRNLVNASFTADADDEAVPAGLRTLVSLSHDGPTYFGPIEIVGAEQLGALKGRHGSTGVPRYAGVMNGTLRFAPVPNAAFTLRITYWQTITALSAGVNWLYTAHPHIYLRATLAEAGPWVQGDAKAIATVQEAAARLESDLENLHHEVWDDQWGGGPLVVRFDPIG